MRPSAQISVNGKPVSSVLWSRLISLQITDNAGEEADQIEIELEDGSPFIEIPKKGDVITAALGYLEMAPVDKGRFTVDDVELPILPYKMTIRGHAADMRAGMKSRKERHWDGKTFGDVVESIAGDHGLKASVAAQFKNIRFPGDWLGQQDESDLHLMERLARQYGAVFAVKDGRLLIAPRSTGMSASGQAMEKLVITPFMIVRDSCRVRFSDRGRYKKVVTYTDEKGKQKRKEVEVESDPDGEATYRLPEPFADEDEARRAAEGMAKDLKTSADTTECTILGDAAVEAGAIMTYAGVRPGVDGIEWTLGPVVHFLTKRGFTTRLFGTRKAA